MGLGCAKTARRRFVGAHCVVFFSRGHALEVGHVDIQLSYSRKDMYIVISCLYHDARGAGRSTVEKVR